MISIKRMVKVLVILFSILFTIAGLISCSISNALSMTDSTLYGDSKSVVVTEIDGKVYICKDDANSKKQGIFRYDNGKINLIYEGHVSSMKTCGRWIYFIDIKSSARDALWRIDTRNDKVETVIEHIGNFTVCPAGIFWVVESTTPYQINRADLDGSNISAFYIPDKDESGTIGGIEAYHNSLYFVITRTRYPYAKSIHYRVDLKTKAIEIPVELQSWRVDDNTTKLSTNSHKLVNIDPVKMWMFDSPREFSVAKDGWIYFGTGPMWYDPVTLLSEPRNEGPYYLYKIKENGTERTKLFTLTGLEFFFALRDGWFYYYLHSENGDTVWRIKDDGSGKQNIIGEPCIVKNVVNEYLYYSYDYEKMGKSKQDNLFRINLNTLASSEQLY